MENSQFVASIHNDYLPFVSVATDEELAQFVRAQIRVASGEELPELSGMAKALYDAHAALIERLATTRKKKSDAGKRGGNPVLKQPQAEVKQCLSTGNAEVKPVTVTDTVTNTKGHISSSAQPPKEQGPEFSENSEEMRLCLLLAEHMRRNNQNVKLPANYQGWCKHIGLMIRIDNRAPPDIERVILFSQKDTFWRANILSAKKLREKYDQLVLKMQGQSARQSERPAHRKTNEELAAEIFGGGNDGTGNGTVYLDA